MRILQVTPYFESAWAYGGIPRVVASLSRALAARGHEVTVCTTDARDEGSRLSPGERRAEGLDLRVFSNVSNRLAYHLQLFAPLGLDGFLRDAGRRFDVAHIHGCHHLPGSIAARRMDQVRTPWVLTAHGTAPRIERRVAGKWLFDHTLGRPAAPARARRVVAVSKAELAQLQALEVSHEQLRLIANPVELSEFDAAATPGRFRDRFGLGDAPMVLFLGKLTPRKGVDLLVRAFAALPDPRTMLVIAGNDLGAGEAVNAEVERLGLAARVRRVGLLQGPHRIEALADADVVVYPSQHEVFGLVPLEALLAGTPVVVSGDSGCGEIISEIGGGLVVPQGDVPALSTAMARVLSGSEDWRAAAGSAQAQIRARFAPQEIAAEHEALYRELF
jgi:glycosyltransferase involved in cell wall biosynthesis